MTARLDVSGASPAARRLICGPHAPEREDEPRDDERAGDDAEGNESESVSPTLLSILVGSGAAQRR